MFIRHIFNTRYPTELVQTAKNLRMKGKTRSEIEAILRVRVPRATFSYWIQHLVLSDTAQRKLDRQRNRSLDLARSAAVAGKKLVRQEKYQRARKRNIPLVETFQELAVAKIALAMLYLGEGAKTSNRAALTLGNANPDVMRLYLKLLTRVYAIDRSKLRGTVQCRADQDITELERYWQNLTGIPTQQWYHAQVDPRSIGKTTKRPHYKGVCRIDYFSAEVFTDLTETIKLLLE